MYLPSLLMRELGRGPERYPQYWEADLLNGVVMGIMQTDQSMTEEEIHSEYDMEFKIYKLLDCHTHFYNIFISELNIVICELKLKHGTVTVRQLARPLVHNIERHISPEMYVPPAFLDLQELVKQLDNTVNDISDSEF